MNKEKKTKHNNNWITKWVIPGLLIVIIIIMAFSINVAYRQGIQDGRKDYENETLDQLLTLGNAISEKSNFNQSASNILKDVPTEINEEGINTYLNNLATLGGNINTDEVKNIINEFIEKWQSFKEIYLTEDNDAITEAFNNLKSESTTITSKIREAYDIKITDALNNL